MNIRIVTRVSEAVVHQMFKSNADTVDDSDSDCGFDDTDKIVPRGSDIGMDPVREAFEREVCPSAKIQCSLQFRFRATSITVISELRCGRSQDRTVSGKRYRAEMDVTIQVRALTYRQLGEYSAAEGYRTELKCLVVPEVVMLECPDQHVRIPGL